MMTLMLLLLFAVAVVWPLARYAASLVSNYRAGFLGQISGQSGGLVWPVCRGILTALMAEVVAVLFYPFGWFRKFRHEGSGTPIVMVHGLFHNASAWTIMMRRLERAGFENLRTYQYNSFSKNFDQAVAGLEQTLDRVFATHPEGKVILMGHSLGGLVCRAVAGNPRYKDHIAGLVALGTPHNGSELAWLGGNRMSRGLIPNRGIPKAVAALPDHDCPKLAIYTLLDDFVFPLNMLHPKRKSWAEIICSPMAHVWMLYSKEVTTLVIKFLRSL